MASSWPSSSNQRVARRDRGPGAHCRHSGPNQRHPEAPPALAQAIDSPASRRPRRAGPRGSMHDVQDRLVGKQHAGARRHGHLPIRFRYRLPGNGLTFLGDILRSASLRLDWPAVRAGLIAAGVPMPAPGRLAAAALFSGWQVQLARASDHDLGWPGAERFGAPSRASDGTRTDVAGYAPARSTNA